MLAPYWRLLRNNRNYRLLWIAQLISELGDWFYALAVYDLLLSLTGNSAQAVALAVVLQVLPHTLAAPASGVLNDRLSRRTIMIAADIARVFIVLGMLLVRTPGMVWLVYPLLLVETAGAAFFDPAHSAVIPNIVAESDLLAANALGSITWSFCLSTGAALGGVTAVFLGRDAVFALNAVSFLASAWLIRRMRFCEPHTEGMPPLCRKDLVNFRPVLEGVRYIRRDRRLLATIFVKFGMGLLGANNVLLPVLGERVFPVKLAGMDPARGAMLGMSLLMGARGAGSLIGPVAASWWAGERDWRLRLGILASFGMAAAGYLWLGGVTGLAIAMAAVLLAHAGSSINWVFSTTLLQSYTEDRFRGRVFAADTGLLTLGIAGSSYLAGVAIDAGVAPREIATALGLVMIVPGAAWAIIMSRK